MWQHCATFYKIGSDTEPIKPANEKNVIKKWHFSHLNSSKGPLTDIKHLAGQLSKERKQFLPEEKNLHVVAAVAGSRVMFLEQFFFTGVAGISFSFFRLLYGTKSRIGPLWVEKHQKENEKKKGKGISWGTSLETLGLLSSFRNSSTDSAPWMMCGLQQ